MRGLILCGLVFLASCTPPAARPVTPDAGFVVQKQARAAHAIQLAPGRTQIAPAGYYLTIETDAPAPKTQTTFAVPKEVYDAFNEGDWYDGRHPERSRHQSDDPPIVVPTLPVF